MLSKSHVVMKLLHHHEKLILESSSGKLHHENCVLFMRENHILFINHVSTLMSQSYTYTGARERAHHVSTLMRHESYAYSGANLLWLSKVTCAQESICQSS
jgi:hypothetical protein